MNNTLVNQFVVENVIQSKMRGKIAYQSHLSALDAINLTYVKPYDHPSGKGYQRPVDTRRCNDFALYLSIGDDALFTPILLNAGGNWEFVSYDRTRPSFGRLICRGKATLMDGQHRLGGISRYIQETGSNINVPFLAFHYLDEDEEIKLFDTINTKAKGIGSSLSRFLRRDSDDISWVATQLIINPKSPFHHIGSIIGKRSKGRHITLQNLYKTLNYLTVDPKVLSLKKEDKLMVALHYYNSIKSLFPREWVNYKDYRLTHIVCLDALSISGSRVLSSCFSPNNNINFNEIPKYLGKLKHIDWSTEGSMKYLKGISGSKTLAHELINEMMVN